MGFTSRVLSTPQEHFCSPTRDYEPVAGIHKDRVAQRRRVVWHAVVVGVCAGRPQCQVIQGHSCRGIDHVFAVYTTGEESQKARKNCTLRTTSCYDNHNYSIGGSSTLVYVRVMSRYNAMAFTNA